MESVSLRRRLFGVDPEEVQRALAERDLEVGRLARQMNLAEQRLAEAEDRSQALERRLADAERRALSAERELKHLQATLSSLSLDIARKEQEAEALRLEADDLRRQLEWAVTAGSAGLEQPGRGAGDDRMTRFLVAEVAPILRAAEDSAAALMEQARAASGQQLAEIGQARNELRAQFAVITEWWDGVRQVVAPVQERIASTRRTIEEVGERIQGALVPLSGLMATIGEELAELTKAATPPPFPAPADSSASTEERSAHEELIVSIADETGVSTETRDHGPPVPAAGRPVGWWPYGRRSAGVGL